MLRPDTFEKLEKEAMEKEAMLKSSTEPSDSKVKKVVDIKENTIDKNAKPLSDDEYDDDYDYSNDDGDNDTDEIVSITMKPASPTKCMFNLCHPIINICLYESFMYIKNKLKCPNSVGNYEYFELRHATGTFA